MPGGSSTSSIQTVSIILAAIIFLTVPLQVGPTNAAGVEEQICDTSADFALGLEDYPAAIELHLNFLSSHLDNALAHYHLGFAYGMMGRVSQEIGEYRKAAKLGMRDWDLFVNLGLAYLEENDYSSAVAALQQSAALGPEHPEAHFNLAIGYERAGRFSDALREVITSLRLAPADPDMRNTQAIICAELGDVSCARDEWELLRQIAPDYVPARTNLSILMGAAPKSTTSVRNTAEIPQLVASEISPVVR